MLSGLRIALVVLLGGACLLEACGASAEGARMPTAVSERRGVTAGGHDHFQGQFSPDGREIYFAANADSTVEIFAIDLARGSERMVFDDHADVSQPRVSPDGRRILYISYQSDAGGSACVRDLDGGGRMCLTRPRTAVLSVFWAPDGRSVFALTRQRLDAPHELRRFEPDEGEQDGELIVTRNMSAPTISPNGRWLAYVPLELRDTAEHHGALTRASPGLLFRRLGGGPTQEVSFIPNLPGTTSFPSFSEDGAYVYFTQYLNDTNFDGVIDGNDNGVLFRVPFRSDESDPARAETYEQLTTGRSNCQYPFASRHGLVATCVRSGHLQIDTLPLGGLIDANWDVPRMEAEFQASRDSWEQLLLLQRMVALTESLEGRRALYRRIVTTHLALREYESADFYLGLLARLSEGDPALEGWVRVEREIVDHRREEQRLRYGNVTSEFADAQEARLRRLDPLFEDASPSTRRLARLAESEIYLVLGDKAQALAMFDAIDIEGETDVAVLQAWSNRGEALLRDLGDRERWAAIHEVLAMHPSLDERERLYHAEAVIYVLSRGRSPGEELPHLERARSRAAARSPLALMLDLELVLARVPTIGEEAAERAIAGIWLEARSFEEQRAVAMATIERAMHRDWARLLYTFGNTWLDAVPKGHPERKYAEALFAEIALERAYVERRNGRPSRELFLDVTMQTSSLEAHIGYLETSLMEGVAPAALRAEYEARFEEGDPVLRFAEAFITARGLARIESAELHDAEIERARALLRPAAEQLPRAAEIHHLYAYLAHRQYHRTGSGEAARAAHARYHLALDLAGNAPRLRASLLIELGMLQAALGNHRIALRHLSERARLPFIDPESELSFRLAYARSLFHTGAYAAARSEMDTATAIVHREASLRRYLPVVVDRAALYHYAIGENEAAVGLYRELAESLGDEDLAARIKARLGLGASALAAGNVALARETLEEVERMLDDSAPFRTERRRAMALSHFDRDDYRPIVSGLLAETHRATGDLAGAEEDLHARLAHFERRHDERPLETYRLEMARVHQQLAELAYRRGDLADARAHVETGLEAVDEWLSHEGIDIDDVAVSLLRSAAELHLYGGVSRGEFSFDLEARLRSAYARVCERAGTRWQHERFLFPIYLAMIEADTRR